MRKIEGRNINRMSQTRKTFKYKKVEILEKLNNINKPKYISYIQWMQIGKTLRLRDKDCLFFFLSKIQLYSI